MRVPALLVALFVAGCNEVCNGPACDSPAPQCAAGSDARLRLEPRWSIRSDEAANPEIVTFIPGDEGRALVSATNAKRLFELFYDDSRIEFGRKKFITTGSDTTGLTSVVVSPGGRIAAITVSDTASDRAEQCLDGVIGSTGMPGASPPGCRCGRVLFVDIRRSDEFGKVMGSIPVGYLPDSSAFFDPDPSREDDGLWLVTADEDDREDQDCQPEGEPPMGRWGGSLSIVRIDSPAALATTSCQTERTMILGADLAACRVGQIAVNHDEDSEPENVTISSQGVVAIAIQETNEIGLACLPDTECARQGGPPYGSMKVWSLAGSGGEEKPEGMARASGVSEDGLDDGAPDGCGFSRDGRWLAVGLEDTAHLLIIDVADPARPTIVGNHDIAEDVPANFNRDERRVPIRVHEPEQLAFVESQGARFVAVTLQESHSVVSYRIGNDGQPVFDSISSVGVGWRDELGGTGSSLIGPEGISAREDWDSTGRALVLTASEREGSVTLLRSLCPATN